MISIKPEVVQCPKPDCIGVLVLRKRLAVPSYGTGNLGDVPWRAAVALVVERSVICPSGLLGRGMKPDAAEVCSSSQWHTEGLNGAIEVLVIHSVLVMPDASRWISDFVGHEPDAVVTGIGLKLSNS